MTPEEKTLRKAESQFGVIGRDQAINAGFSESAVDRRVATGKWKRIFPSVYRLAGSAESWHQQLMGIQIWAGPGTLLSHRSASALLGLDGITAGFVEVTFSRPRRVPPGVIGHSSEQILTADRARFGPFYITSGTRTVIDIATIGDEEILELVLESALRLKLTNVDRLLRRIEELGPKGRRGFVVLQRTLRERDPSQRPTDSEFETRFLRALSEQKVPLPERQVTVASQGKFVARLDFAYTDLRIAIECDSFRHHSESSDLDEDARRQTQLAALGWLVLRATWRDHINASRFVASLKRAIDLRLPSKSEVKRKKVL